MTKAASFWCRCLMLFWSIFAKIFVQKHSTLLRNKNNMIKNISTIPLKFHMNQKCKNTMFLRGLYSLFVSISIHISGFKTKNIFYWRFSSFGIVPLWYIRIILQMKHKTHSNTITHTHNVSYLFKKIPGTLCISICILTDFHCHCTV